MQVYHFNPLTGELVGSEMAKRDPRNADRYLVPAYATETPPPAIGENEATVFQAGAWRVVADFRGSVCYDPNTGEELEIQELDQVPNVTDPPPADFRAPKWNGTEWVDDWPWTVSELREREYLKEDLSPKDMVVALWEMVVEKRPEAAQAIQAKRMAIIAKYPKPE